MSSSHGTDDIFRPRNCSNLSSLSAFLLSSRWSRQKVYRSLLCSPATSFPNFFIFVLLCHKLPEEHHKSALTDHPTLGPEYLMYSDRPCCRVNRWVEKVEPSHCFKLSPSFPLAASPFSNHATSSALHQRHLSSARLTMGVSGHFYIGNYF